MKTDFFDNSVRDTQSTEVIPIKPSSFDFQKYVDYENELNERCLNFQNSDEGVLVYRRMRVADVYSYGCKDMATSLELQLGALEKSMKYKADVPNFLEPWYGIGIGASAYHVDYEWPEGQAPAIKSKFKDVNEANEYHSVDIANTNIGRHNLKMIEYFLEETKGMLPMSFCDIQSPLNVASNLVDINQFMMDTLIDPDAVAKFLDTLADHIIKYALTQKRLIGDCLANPGHGFASSREFKGFGMSDDNVVMLPNDTYKDLIIPSFEKVGQELGGAVFHSCGNWQLKIEVLKRIKGIVTMDGAFSNATDPDPNETEPFRKSFPNTGIVLQSRIVGAPELIIEKVKGIWAPGMKLVVVTNCQTPEEQAEVYEAIHRICN